MKRLFIAFFVLFMFSSVSNARRISSARSGSNTADQETTTHKRTTSSRKRSARSGSTRSTNARSTRGQSSSVNETETSERSARSTRSGRARSSRSSGGTATTSRRQTAPKSSSARAGVSRSGVIPSMTPSMTNVTGRNNVQQEYQEVDKEEQLLGMEETKKRWGVCMDDFCNDTDSINPAYRCLCSANIAKLKPLEKKVHKKMKQLLQLTSNVEAAKMGIQYQIFNEATLEKLGLTEDESDTENPWDLDNVNYGLDQLLGEENKRKEGLALFKDALLACNPYLKLSASFKKHIVASYQASTQKSCLAFQNSLTGKLRKMDFVFQSAYNKLQKAEHKEANQFTAEECSKQVKNVLITTAGCGENFENCQTKALLESKRIIVSDILDKCENVNKNDVIWKEIVNSGKLTSRKHSKSLVSQCANDLKDCMQPHCGNGWVDCATDNDIEYKKNYCLVKLDPCLNDKNRIWNQFKAGAIKFGQKTLADQGATNNVAQCETDKMNFKSCVNLRCEGKWSECAGTPAQCSIETFGNSCETAEKTNLVTYFDNKITNTPPTPTELTCDEEKTAFVDCYNTNVTLGTTTTLPNSCKILITSICSSKTSYLAGYETLITDAFGPKTDIEIRKNNTLLLEDCLKSSCNGDVCSISNTLKNNCLNKLDGVTNKKSRLFNIFRLANK